MKRNAPPLNPASKLVLHTDGASRGNPGPAGAGAVLLDESGRQVAEFKKYLGEVTNNVAEYQALILGLEESRKLGVQSLEVKLDSELLVRQLNGQYRVKSPGLLPLFQQVRRLLQDFTRVDIIHVKREFNSAADLMANQAIDGAGPRNSL